MPFTRWADARGMSLVDAMVASGILIVGIVSLAQLFVVAARSRADTARLSIAAALAAQKLEELRALRWSVDLDGGAVADTTSDTVLDEPTGGTGLTPTSCAVLSESTPGYVDYWDDMGARVPGTGADPPPRAAFARRWCVSPLAADPADTLLLQARVVPVASGGRDVDHRTRLEEAWLVTARTRRAE